MNLTRQDTKKVGFIVSNEIKGRFSLHFPYCIVPYWGFCAFTRLLMVFYKQKYYNLGQKYTDS